MDITAVRYKDIETVIPRGAFTSSNSFLLPIGDEPIFIMDDVEVDDFVLNRHNLEIDNDLCDLKTTKRIPLFSSAISISWLIELISSNNDISLSLVDIGCGSGRDLAFYGGYCEEIMLIDSRKRMLQNAKNIFDFYVDNQNISVQYSNRKVNVENFIDQEFDIVVTILALGKKMLPLALEKCNKFFCGAFFHVDASIIGCCNPKKDNLLFTEDELRRIIENADFEILRLETVLKPDGRPYFEILGQKINV
ncbi:hypothetical protein PCE1_000485 [Barthelona sp. PCE]